MRRRSQGLGEAHKQKAQAYITKVKGEVDKLKWERHTCTKSGGKHLSAAIDDQKGKPMTNIVRDQDTADGGTKGQIASNPADIDGIVKRAWQAIHEGADGCIETAVDLFLGTCCSTVHKRRPFEVEDITADMVQASFSKTRGSAGALHGWSPKELSLLSRKTYGHIAVLLDQIEKGAPWPKSALHARVVFLEKPGATTGQVMSCRPLAITSPLYRCCGTMRLKSCEPRIREWALP